MLVYARNSTLRKVPYMRLKLVLISLFLSAIANAQVLKVAQGIQLFDGAGGSNPAKVSPVNQARLRYNLGLNRLEQSLNGAAYAALSGGGGGCATLAACYAAGASQTDTTMLLDTTRLGVRIRDNATPLGPSLFSIQSSTGAVNYLDVGSNQGTFLSQAVATTGSPLLFSVLGAAHTGLTASTDIQDINLDLARTVQFSTGAKTLQRAMLIRAPTYGAVAATTTTDAATLATSGPPIAGTNMTLTRSHDVWLGGGKVGSSLSLINTTTVATGSSRAGFAVNDVNASAATDVMFQVQTNGTARLSYRFDRRLWNPTGSSGLTLDDAGTMKLNAGAIDVVTVFTGSVSSTTDLQTGLGTSALRYSNVWARQHNGVQPADVANAASVTFTVANGEVQRFAAGATAMTISGTAGNPGEKITACIVEDGTGTRTASFATGANNFKVAGGAFTLTATASKIDCLSFVWDTVGTVWLETSRAQNL